MSPYFRRIVTDTGFSESFLSLEAELSENLGSSSSRIGMVREGSEVLGRGSKGYGIEGSGMVSEVSDSY